jgi:hypothetical protein
MYEQKTRPGTGDVDAFLMDMDDPARRADSQALVALMADASGEVPVLWGSMVGFGQYHFRYASGHKGNAFLIGFAPRKNEFSIYLMGCYLPGAEERRNDLLKRLGRHRMGKACLYIKRISDIDLTVLREMAELSVDTLRAAYPDTK